MSPASSVAIGVVATIGIMVARLRDAGPGAAGSIVASGGGRIRASRDSGAGGSTSAGNRHSRLGVAAGGREAAHRVERGVHVAGRREEAG